MNNPPTAWSGCGGGAGNGRSAGRRVGIGMHGEAL